MAPTTVLRIQQAPIEERRGFDAIFNASYLDDIHAELTKWGSTRVLLVVSGSLDSNSDKIKTLEDRLGNTVVDKKVGVGGHSPYSDVIDIAKRAHTLNVDAVVCVGSGSYTDACKIGLLIHGSLPSNVTEEDIESLVDQDTGTTRAEMIKPRLIKLIVVPTTLSSGEWNSVASSTNSAGKKQHFNHPTGVPDLIVWDPRLAVTTPERVWLASGIRCIDHCVELLCNGGILHETSKYMTGGLEILTESLMKYKELKGQGDEEQLLASISACQYATRVVPECFVAFHLPVGPSHAITHQLGPITGLLHGETSCIILPPVMHYTKQRYPEAQQSILNIFNTKLGWKENEAADAVSRFIKSLGFKTRLTEVGITEDAIIRKIARNTMTDFIRIDLSEEDILAILRLAT